jgi:hypothetical protein
VLYAISCSVLDGVLFRLQRSNDLNYICVLGSAVAVRRDARGPRSFRPEALEDTRTWERVIFASIAGRASVSSSTTSFLFGKARFEYGAEHRTPLRDLQPSWMMSSRFTTLELWPEVQRHERLTHVDALVPYACLPVALDA